MFGFKMKLGLDNKVLLPEYGQKKVLDLGQFVSSNSKSNFYPMGDFFKPCPSRSKAGFKKSPSG
jgi:hypothetical protein